MATVSFHITQTKRAEDTVSVPDEIIAQGREAIVEFLERRSHMDNALDYAETQQETIINIE